MRRFVQGLVFFWSLTLGSVLAFEIPENSGQTVLDQAKVFSGSEAYELRTIIASIEAETTAEVAIWTVPTLDGYPIFNAALEAGRKWGVGQKENDNGVILVIAVNDRDWFIATGYGVEGILPDVTVKRIGERHFPPNFRNNNYANGVRLALLDIKALLKSDPSVIAEYKETSKAVLWSLHICVALSLFCLSVYRKRDNMVGGIFVSLFTTFHFLVLAGAFLFSAGLVLYFALVIFYSFFALSSELQSGGSSRGGWSSGGGFSGGGFSSGSFGGGSFGGGGSGGSW